MSTEAPDTLAAAGRLPAEEKARVDIYRLLAVLLAAPPDPQLLDLLQRIEQGDGELAETWAALRQAAAEANTDSLDDEYHALFIGLGRGELSPHASWYLTGFLMEKPLAELRTELSRMGFVRRDDVAEPEDHAAALCETMAMILTENRLSYNESKIFFESHIGSWMGRFFEDLMGTESARFYRSVGRLGQAFIRIETQYYSMPV